MDAACSPIFVPELPLNGAPYGTRCQTVVAVWASGAIEAHERSLCPPGREDCGWQWRRHTVVSSLVA